MAGVENSSPKEVDPAEVSEDTNPKQINGNTRVQGARSKNQEEPKEVKKTERVKLKPPIPSKEEKPMIAPPTQKNFLKSNAIEAKLTVPKRKEAEQMDYLQKDDYGKIPEYISKVKEDLEKEKQAREEAEEKARNGDNPFRLLSFEEKEEMIEGLKQNWEKINNAYRQLPVTVNTVTQKNRKEQYEKQLAAIEKDLEKLSKRFVYVEIDK